MMRLYKLSTVLVILFFIHSEISAQQSLEEISKDLSPFISTDSIRQELDNIYYNVLHDPETLNFILSETYKLINPNNLLSGLDLKFKTFQFDTVSAIGLNYNYKRSLKTTYFNSTASSASGFNFSLQTNGNISFIKKYNPDDFLKSSLSAGYFKSIGGAVEITDALSDSLTKIQFELSNFTDIDSLNNSPLWKNYLRTVSQYLTTQLFIDFSLQAGIESNQDFSMKNYVYSAVLGLDVKAWNKNSALAQLNIFDWPFALTRWITGTDNEISPRGSSLPTILINISYIDPAADRLRKILNETKKYSRFGFEIGFKSLISNTLGIPLYFNTSLRYYKAPGAPAAIKSLNLDESFYFVALITQGDGVFVSYTTGSLPYDIKRDDVFAIGFNYNF